MRKIFSFILILMLFGLPGVLQAADDAEMTVSQEEKDRICQMVKEKKYQLMEFVSLEESGIDIEKLMRNPFVSDGSFSWENNEGGLPQTFDVYGEIIGGIFHPMGKVVSIKQFRDAHTRLLKLLNLGYGGRCSYDFIVAYNDKKNTVINIPSTDKKIIGGGLKYRYEYPSSFPMECKFYNQEIIKINEGYYLLTFINKDDYDDPKNPIRVDKLIQDEKGNEKNIFLCDVIQIFEIKEN